MKDQRAKEHKNANTKEGKKPKENGHKYLVPALSTIGIAVTILVALFQWRILELQFETIHEIGTLKAEEVLAPAVIFNTVRDVNKREPVKVGDTAKIKDFKPYGNEGFLVRWEKETQQWLGIEWRLNRKNYGDRYRYFLYMEVKANKEDDIVLVLEDNEKRYTSIPIKLTNTLDQIIVPFGSVNEYLKDIPDPDNPEKIKTITVDTFNWSSVELARISPFYEEEEDNTIFFKKMKIMWLITR